MGIEREQENLYNLTLEFLQNFVEIFQNFFRYTPSEFFCIFKIQAKKGKNAKKGGNAKIEKMAEKQKNHKLHVHFLDFKPQN